MLKSFAGFDYAGFWEPPGAADSYVGPPPTPEIVAAVEHALGYRLPAAYVEFMQYQNDQNGGQPRRTNHRTRQRTSWAADHVAISGLHAIGSEPAYSLCGDMGSRFWIEEWGYPEIGIYFADCPSAGHDMLWMDYRECGRNRKPRPRM